MATNPSERTPLFTPGADRWITSELNRMAGEYLPRIAVAGRLERRRLLCEFADRAFDICTEPRARLCRSWNDLGAFSNEMKTYLSRVIMPLWHPLQLSKSETHAVDVVISGKISAWHGKMIGRLTEMPGEARSGESTESAESEPDPIARERRQLVDNYIAEGRKQGIAVTRASIWRTAGYRSRTDFERWERNDRRASRKTDQNIRRVLREKPGLRNAASKTMK